MVLLTEGVHSPIPNRNVAPVTVPAHCREWSTENLSEPSGPSSSPVGILGHFKKKKTHFESHLLRLWLLEAVPPPPPPACL
uniref:Uncharacterized protein n=1 Tax=Anguilla anguilla TaxID=7936 RepID=A0A0E9WMT0_ANGAN